MFYLNFINMLINYIMYINMIFFFFLNITCNSDSLFLGGIIFVFQNHKNLNLPKF